MFVVSLSSKRIKNIFTLLFVACIVFVGIAIIVMSCSKNLSNNETLSVNNSGENMEQLMDYVSSLGWEVSPEPDEVREIVIPSEFDEVYENYNELQLSQGYDLKQYAGERAKNWTFTVLNYPGYENEDFIKINILVCNGRIIGGDVCSVELNGFMHGFIKE